MAKISASASLGVKLKFPSWDKRFDAYENVSPHASISIEKDVQSPDGFDEPSDELLLEEAQKIYNLCRKFVESKINDDIQSSKSKKP